MTATVGDDWIETEPKGPGRTLWTVVRRGQALHSEEQSCDDPSGARAFEAGLQWAEQHCPGVVFHWRHQTHAAVAMRARGQTPPEGFPRRKTVDDGE